jgi:PhzF family phenazine biosynthesis protein
MQLPLYQVDAFASAPFTGNPAAVCPLDDWIPDALMQAIAEENALSETAFFVGLEGHYALRWFTPVAEVDLCGHATLAAAYVVFANEPGLSRITFDSRSGPLRVTREGDALTLDFPAQPGEPCEIPPELVAALGAEPIECFRKADYLAVFRTQAEVAALKPDLGQLRNMAGRGVIVTAPGEQCDFVSRFFAPKFGVDEDPVTGSAHCTMAPYWGERLGKDTLSAHQLSRRGGDLLCRLAGDRVFISGRVVPYLRGTIELVELPKP